MCQFLTFFPCFATPPPNVPFLLRSGSQIGAGFSFLPDWRSFSLELSAAATTRRILPFKCHSIRSWCSNTPRRLEDPGAHYAFPYIDQAFGHENFKGSGYCKRVSRRHSITSSSSSTDACYNKRRVPSRLLFSITNMSWFTSDSTPALAWKELNGNSIRVGVTSALMTNAAVYHASKTWDEHVCSSGLPENRDAAITLIRQFIARYVHDLIVKHNLTQLWDEREYISKDAFERVHSIANQKRISQR